MSERIRLHHFPDAINRQLKELSVSDNWHSVVALSGDYAIIAAAAWLSIRFYAFYPLAVLIIGARQRALATIMHDAAHLRAARDRRLNRLLGTYLTAYPIFQSFGAYVRSHVHQHHRYLGDPVRDPDFVFYQEIGLYHARSGREFFLKHVLATFLLLNSPTYAYYLVRHRLSAFARDKREALAFVATWVAIIAGAAWLNALYIVVLFWFVPYLTSFMIIGRFIEIAEHYPLLGRNRDPLAMSRNRFSSPVEAFFLSIHQENFHLVHHLRACIPWWNLPRAHAAMMQDPAYQAANGGFGGVFRSSNGQPALIPSLVRGTRSDGHNHFDSTEGFLST